MCLKNKKPNKLWEDALREGESYKFRVGGYWFNHIPFPELKLEECDAEESKKYWYIDYDGGILHSESDNSSAEEMLISLGNHFESLEEAEQAVEKLQAFKRLRDKGFEFINFPYKKTCKYDARTGVGNLEYQVKYYEELESDLNILFGDKK